MAKHDDGVLIFVNSNALLVPATPHCFWATRGVLGLARWQGLCYESGNHGVNLDTSIFYEDERYVTRPMKLGPPRGTRIWVNGRMVFVPASVDCNWAARGALGAPRGIGIAFEREPLYALDFQGGCSFAQDARYIFMGEREDAEPKIREEELPPSAAELAMAGGAPDLTGDEPTGLISAEDDNQPFQTDPNFWKPEGWQPESEEEK